MVDKIFVYGLPVIYVVLILLYYAVIHDIFVLFSRRLSLTLAVIWPCILFWGIFIEGYYEKTDFN